MKIIDLLNKIANNEETPDKIRFNGEYYIYNTTYDDYKSPSTWLLKNHNDNLNCFLNDEVEIIEEEKEIEISKITKEEFERLDKRTLLELIVKNQNELIDVINKLKSGKNE